MPGSLERHAEDGTGVPVARRRAWELLQLRIGLGAGLDPLPVPVGLRRSGVSRSPPSSNRVNRPEPGD